MVKIPKVRQVQTIEENRQVFSAMLAANPVKRMEMIEQQVIEDYLYLTSKELGEVKLKDSRDPMKIMLRHTPEYLNKITFLQKAHILPAVNRTIQLLFEEKDYDTMAKLQKIESMMADSMNKNKQPLFAIQINNGEKPNAKQADDISDLKY